jgi:hypothetical protein
MICSPSLNRIARPPVDCCETCANAANHRNVRRAKIRNLLPVHDARPGVQEVMGFAAILSRANEQFEVARGELGHLEGLTIAIVAAEHDDAVVGAAVQNTEGVRPVRDKGAVAPGVERVPSPLTKPIPSSISSFAAPGKGGSRSIKKERIFRLKTARSTISR